MAVKLKELRDDAGLSQAELADACGLDPSFVSLLERGLRNATIYKAMAIAAVLSKKLERNVTVAEVFGTEPGRLPHSSHTTNTA